MKFSKDKILNSLQKVLKYYQYFGYAPTIAETQKFLDIKLSSANFKESLKYFLKNNNIILIRNRLALSKRIIKSTIFRQKRAQMLLGKVKPLFNLFYFIPMVRLLGISGSMSMNQSDKIGDIDIFVITSDGYLWCTRFILLIIKKVLVLQPFFSSDKLCFNLFFSTSQLSVPKLKQTPYVGHEVLQLKIISDKDDIYQIFLRNNIWIKKFFPNVHIISNNQHNDISLLKKVKEPNNFERFAKKVQIWWLKRTGYRYKQYLGQLWLFQEDWEKKIRAAEVAGFEPA